jgi:hypothetical protein
MRGFNCPRKTERDLAKIVLSPRLATSGLTRNGLHPAIHFDDISVLDFDGAL